MKHVVTSFLKDDSGAAALEYGLIAFLIAVALIGAISGLAPKIAAVYESAARAIPVD